MGRPSSPHAGCSRTPRQGDAHASCAARGPRSEPRRVSGRRRPLRLSPSVLPLRPGPSASDTPAAHGPVVLCVFPGASLKFKPRPFPRNVCIRSGPCVSVRGLAGPLFMPLLTASSRLPETTHDVFFFVPSLVPSFRELLFSLLASRLSGLCVSRRGPLGLSLTGTRVDRRRPAAVCLEGHLTVLQLTHCVPLV